MKEVYFQRFVFQKIQDIVTSIEVLDGYNKTFFRRKKVKNIDTLLESARYAHNNKLIYFVTITENQKPYCAIEINEGFFRVNFIDEFLRNYMSYDFVGRIANINIKWREDIPFDKLFLNRVIQVEFNGQSEIIDKTTDFIFHPDGSFHVTTRDVKSKMQTDSKANNKTDVSNYWEDYPNFGNYDSIIKKERGSVLGSLQVEPSL